MSSSYSSSDSDDGILTTKNVAVDFKRLEQRGAEIELSDDDLPIQSPPKRSKVQFSPNYSKKPSKPVDAQSVASTRSSVSRYSIRSNFSQKTYASESDKLSRQFERLGLNMNLDEFEMECEKKAKENYEKMVQNKFKKLIDNRKKIRSENRTNERFNLKREQLFKLSRPDLIKKNEQIRTQIANLKKQIKEIDNETIMVSQELEKYQDD